MAAPKTPAKSRRYSNQEVERILGALAFCDGNSASACRLLAEEGVQVYPRTLQRWKESLYRTRYEVIQGVYDRSSAERLRTYHWPAIGKAAQSLVSRVAQEGIRELQEGDIKAARKRARDIEYFARQQRAISANGSQMTPGRVVSAF